MSRPPTAALQDEPWASLRDLWTLPPGVRYLNHGSFGPAPRPVLQARERWTARLESQPMDFLTRVHDPALAAARRKLGEFMGARGDDLIFVDNATVGMNVVAGSVRLQPGDEVLLNDHEYGAVLRIWQRACRRSGAAVQVAQLPCPLESARQMTDALFARLTPRTRLIVASHVTSPTAIVFPIEEICGRARELGVAICIDGPHAVAMRDVRLAQLDCDYYAASCHKWLCAPFGSGFLYVHPRAQGALEPVATSWGRPALDEPPSWRDEFTWVGTRDPAAYLATSDAIAFLAGIGLEAFRERTHALAQYAREKIGAWTGLPALVPDDPAWYGSMISLPLPPGDAPNLQRALWERHRIEVPIIDWNGRRLVRPSCHLYTTRADLDALLVALQELTAAGF